MGPTEVRQQVPCCLSACAYCTPAALVTAATWKCMGPTQVGQDRKASPAATLSTHAQKVPPPSLSYRIKQDGNPCLPLAGQQGR